MGYIDLDTLDIKFQEINLIGIRLDRSNSKIATLNGKIFVFVYGTSADQN